MPGIYKKLTTHLNTGISGIERYTYIVMLYIQFGIFYLIANRFIGIENAHDISMRIDGLIPFVPSFIYPYMFIYIFSFLPALVVTDRKLFFRAYAGFTALTVVSAAIFVFFPVKVVRSYEIPSGITGLLFSELNWMDNPVCGFPSLHVGWTLLATLVIYRENRFIGTICSVICAITIASTMLTKQHVVADALGGILMAVLVDFFIIHDWSGFLARIEIPVPVRIKNQHAHINHRHQ